MQTYKHRAKKHLYHLLRSSSAFFQVEIIRLVSCVFIHDDMDSNEDLSDSMIDYAFAYFECIHLRSVDVVEDIENERTLNYPRAKE